MREWIFDAADKELGRGLDLFAVLEFAGVHPAHHLDQVDRIEVEHFARLRLIAPAHVVAGEAHHVAHAERVRAEQVALHRDAVAVAASHLDHWLTAVLDRHHRRADAAHAHDRRLIVGDIGGIADAAEESGFFVNHRGVAALRRTQFGGHREYADLQDLLPIAASFLY